MNRSILSLFVASVAILAMPVAARAQYYNPYYNPYYRGGNALQGAAAVTNAQGDYAVQVEQARILREQALQAKLDTKKKAFDQMLYEKANTPTYTEELAKDKQQLLKRLMTYPVRSEITDGITLNAMLPLVEYLSSQGAPGPPIPVPQSMVNLLNIAGSNSSSSSVGMLRGGGQVEWPIALQGPQQQKLDKLLPAACDAAAAGKLTAKMLKDVRTQMDIMRETLRQQLQKEEIDGSSYMRALEFYNSLRDSVSALERPDARKQLAGAYAPRARNVQELIDFMSDNGLRFAPASPGNENAYQVVHDAFVRYARVAQAGSGVQALNSPMPSSRKK
jgi:hypothetical protein